MKCDEIFAALDMLEKERGISPSFMMEKIVQALTTAYKRDHEGVEKWSSPAPRCPWRRPGPSTAGWMWAAR